MWPVPRRQNTWRRARRHRSWRRAWIQACGRRNSLSRSLSPSLALYLSSPSHRRRQLGPPSPAPALSAAARSSAAVHRPSSAARRSPPSLPHPLPRSPSLPQSSFHVHRRRGRPLLLLGVPVGRRAAAAPPSQFHSQPPSLLALHCSGCPSTITQLWSLSIWHWLGAQRPQLQRPDLHRLLHSIRKKGGCFSPWTHRLSYPRPRFFPSSPLRCVLSLQAPRLGTCVDLACRP